MARDHIRERIYFMSVFRLVSITNADRSLVDERLQGPFSIPLNHIDLSRANSRSGVAQLAWNTNGSSLLARFGQSLDRRFTVSI